MQDYSFESIVYLGKSDPPPVLKAWCTGQNLDLTVYHDPMKALKEQKAPPSLVFTQVVFGNVKGASLLKELSGRWPGAMVVALDKVGLEAFTSEVIRAGAVDYLIEPVDAETLFRTMEKCEMALRACRERQNLKQKSEQSEMGFHERAVILETLLDLLSHDTRNMFLNLRSLLHQFEEGPLRSMTEDAVDELYNTTMEAVGYLHNGKRIHNLVDLVSQLRLTRDRIPLDGHPRITFLHDSQYLLFCQTSPLIKNAITNLVENAFKYSPEEGRVTVELRRAGAFVEITVSDEGIGISDEDKTHVFDRYFRTGDTSRVYGTGRGLWITRNIVKEENGTISVEDNANGGTVFRIKVPSFRVASLESGFDRLCEWYELPRDELDTKARNIMTLLELQGFRNDEDFDSLVIANLLRSLRQDRKEQHRRHFRAKLHALKKKNPDGATVLVVDDSLYVHYYLGTYLTSLGYRVVDFGRNGEEGVTYYKTYKPDFVTMDITMPVKSGLEAAKALKKDYPDLKIVFLTGLGSQDTLKNDIADFLDKDQYRMLTKPFKRDQLMEVLDGFDVPPPIDPQEAEESLDPADPGATL